MKLFYDGADKARMLHHYANPHIQGFTTNPTLMRRAGVFNYEDFAREIIGLIPDRSISLEVFADNFNDMYEQALKISCWGKNVYVKIPVTNTKGKSTVPLICALGDAGVKLNVTAIFTVGQARPVIDSLGSKTPSYISLFAGRIADTGVNPAPIARHILREMGVNQELIWAGARSIPSFLDAENEGCHIATLTDELLARLPLIGKPLREYSLETVKMFHADALASGFTI